MAHVMSLISFPMSIGVMSHVDFKKGHVALSNLGVKDPNRGISQVRIAGSNGASDITGFITTSVDVPGDHFLVMCSYNYRQEPESEFINRQQNHSVLYV